MNVDPRHDLEAYIRQANTSGEAEADPYSYAATLIAVTIEWALDDGIVGSMSHDEAMILTRVGHTLLEGDPALRIETL